jgi:hypothetical protein
MFFLYLFFLLQNQTTGGRNRSCWGWGLRVGTSGRGEMVGKGNRRVNMVQKMCIYASNAKMIPVETVPGISGGRIKESGRGG